MNVSVDQIRKQRKYCCICKGEYRGQFVDGRVVSLHRFPQNKRLKRVWIQRCRTVMRTFVWNEHRRLCSTHFVGYRGPSLEHTLPSLFPTENGSTKEFTSPKLDENQMVMEIDDNEGMMGGNSQCDIIQDESRSTSDSDGHNTVHDADTMMDVSVSLHEYCASPVVRSRKTGIRSSYVQTYPDCKMQKVQTDLVEVKPLVDASTQTEHLNEDKGVQCRLPNLTYHDVKNNDDTVCFYTGIPNAKVFDALFDEIKDEAEERTSRRQLNYNPTQGGRPRILTVIDEFFMVLMRLRLGLLLEDHSFRFGISATHCSDICNRWIDFLAVQLSFLVQWPSMDVNKRNMPTVFKEKFPKTRIIIDCTEIYTETLSSLKLKSLMYSDYKSHITYKALVGVSPNGEVTFVSDLWCVASVTNKLQKKADC
ncbi:uncharacterized protein LOC123548052 [Mercenaria mercenaria]|uniref:uncharacterized protein LOC123548052 n=1 Tax=Mercenaria mercenaria TaxID=6596 RepID=UPI00234F3735|nr:uncharacterized protein LOC123548052 [Mercenaria mercenaria]